MTTLPRLHARVFFSRLPALDAGPGGLRVKPVRNKPLRDKDSGLRCEKTAQTRAELKKQVKYLNEKNSTLESTVAAQDAKISKLENDNAAQDERIKALEDIVNKLIKK